MGELVSGEVLQNVKLIPFTDIDSVIRITDQEMHAIGREAEGVRFTDGSGYLGQLAVFHNLHCIVSAALKTECTAGFRETDHYGCSQQGIHRFINADYYFPNITALEYKLLQAHNGKYLRMNQRHFHKHTYKPFCQCTASTPFAKQPCATVTLRQSL